MTDAPDRFDLVVRGNRVLTVDGVSAAAVAVRDGRIAAIQPVDADLAASSSVELRSDEVLIPGLVDTHVHVNDPGRTEWEGFATATRAAAAGGITTIVDMPLNSVPPTVDPAGLETKRAVAEGQVHVDVGFWGGAVPDSLGRLRELHDGGVFGFKCFLVPSGVDEFPHLSREQLAVAVREVAELDALLVVHAEDAEVIGSAPPPAGRRYADFLASRPPTAEDSAVEHLAALVRDAGARAHVLHLSSAGALPTLAAARSEGVRLTAETCPHYLTLVADDVPAGATQFKCCPPIRDDDNRGRLWQGLADGLLDCVVSDHSPCTPDLKCLDTGDFGAAWGGIASLQLGLPLVWTHAASRGFGLTDVVRWMATGPADLVGLASKGRIGVGADADLCVFAPDAAWTVDPGALHHRNKVTPYAGMELLGEVRSTWLHGERVTGEAPAGRLLSRAG